MSMETKDLSLFEQMGGTYTEKDGFLYPNLSMEQESEQITVGKYGLLWISYMKETYPTDTDTISEWVSSIAKLQRSMRKPIRC